MSTRAYSPPCRTVGASTRGLAKLTRPRLHDALARPRLYTLIDKALARPVVWICAPPGSGKTTLVAGYLEARKLRYLWYHVDPADSDPATFLHYVREAALHVAGKRAASLPVFTSEPQQDLGRFVRGFCRDLFSALPNPCVIVLDNLHEASAAAAQRVAFAQGLEEIPAGINVLVASRADPPVEFARLVAGGRIAQLHASALRCTADEAAAVIDDARLSAQDLARIQQQCEGWMAALVLLREHLSRSDGVALEESLGAGKEAIFRYFASEVFGGAKVANQHILMTTSIASSITPDEAIELTGSDDAARLLDYLYRRHLFVDRRSGAPTTYHFHALFREFLSEQSERRLSPEERRRASLLAARRLAERGEAAEALALYRDAGDWSAMRELVCAHALEWARQGRAQALSEWIEALPRAMRDVDPWLEYWLGRAWIFTQPLRGRPALERAYQLFRATGDLRGQALTLNTVVTGYYYEWTNFAPLDHWLPEFERLLDNDRASKLDRASELRARAAYLIALLFRRPGESAIDICARRLDALIDEESDVNVRMMAASTLLNYFNWKARDEAADGLVARIQPALADPEVTPLMHVWWRTHVSYWHYRNGRYDDSAAISAEARSIAEHNGLEAYLFELDHAQATTLLTKGLYMEARELIDAMERRLSPARRMDHAYFRNLRANLELRVGNFDAAVRDAERAVALAGETGLPVMQLPHLLARLAHSRICAGDRDGGMRAMDEAIGVAIGTARAHFVQQRELVQIGFDLDAGEVERAKSRLAELFANCRTRRQLVVLRGRPDLMARIANFALEQGIEADYVRLLIQRNQLRAPVDASAAWPFRLRISALGGFSLQRDGESLSFSGKAQQRPLELFKFIVASGGRGVESKEAMAALWPEADGAAAKMSFDTTLFRLRKLLDVDNALVLSGGQISLASDVCRTDIQVLEQVFVAADRFGEESSSSHPGLVSIACRLLEVYRGPLLGSEDAAWIAKPRDVLRARFVRSLMKIGARLEAAQEWPQAIDVYRRGLEADNLAEPFYRGLMRSLAATGDYAEALNAFRRCRELLSIVLGVKPAHETETLRRQIVSRQIVNSDSAGTR